VLTGKFARHELTVTQAAAAESKAAAPAKRSFFSFGKKAEEPKKAEDPPKKVDKAKATGTCRFTVHVFEKRTDGP
jgi:hypothetical protein